MFSMDHAKFHQGVMSAGDIDMLLDLWLATEATPGADLPKRGMYSFGKVVGMRHSIKKMLDPASFVAG